MARRSRLGLLCAAAWVAALLPGASGCGVYDARCVPRPLDGADAYGTLAEWCMVSLVDGELAPHAGVEQYELNTPLYSDSAVKRRTVWMPEGTSAQYDDTGVFQFPDGTVFTKSFGFRDDQRQQDGRVRWIETRVLWRAQGLWHAVSYRWDEAQRAAKVAYGGEVLRLSWVDGQGQPVTTDYLVPNQQQCKQCHESDGVQTPIGPKARNLNRDHAYADGTANQLAHWSGAGLLAGAPDDVARVPRLPVWNDPATGTVERRARAYLEVNCAHCHSAGGTARTTGMSLAADEQSPVALGFCKQPIAAGAGSGGHAYDIVPGKPEDSILVFRMRATEPALRMPQIGRSLTDTEGLALVREWIAGLPGGCAP